MKFVGLSAIHHQHLALNATMVKHKGWMIPAYYTSSGEESARLQDTVGLMDEGRVGKFLIQGDTAEETLKSMVGGYASTKVGKAVAAKTVTDSSKDLLVAQLSTDEYMLLTSATDLASLGLPSEESTCGHVVDITSTLASVRIIGPNSGDLLAQVVELELDPRRFADMSFVQTMVAKVHGMILRRDIGDLLAYQLFFSRDYGEYLWEALMLAGENHGVIPVGLEAMDLLHEGR
jgi:aminomethyltransferase